MTFPSAWLRSLGAITFMALALGAPAYAQQSATQLRSATDSEKMPASSNMTVGRSKKVPAIAADDFRIGADDVLTINVWKEPEISQQVAVRPDGKVSLPLVGQVQASGKTVEQLQAELTVRLKDYLASPVVTVMVKEVRSRSFNVFGQVAKPGTYPLERQTTVLDAIVRAGGFREWAKVRGIYVLRRVPRGDSERIPFDYKKAIRGEGPDMELQPKDTVVIP